jgi:4-carboxymuconolactone decarboxylase
MGWRARWAEVRIWGVVVLTMVGGFKFEKRINKMDKKTFERGREIRSSVLGKEFVDNAFRTADDFNLPLQELVTEYCWGAVWGREELPRKTRSMLNLAMISALNRPHELKAHIKGALVNGVTPVEIREVLLQVAIYCGVPAAVDSFRIAREVLQEQKAQSQS